MQTRVVNVRHFPFDGYGACIYVGRPMPKLYRGHPLGNPFRLGRKDQRDPVKVAACLERYRNWLLPEHEQELRYLAETVRRTNKSLGCWCVPRVMTASDRHCCHAQVLAEYVDLILGRT